MFTGIVEEIGEIVGLQPIGNGKKIGIKAKRILDDLKVEDSVCISGACQTVIKIEGSNFWVEAVGDTLQKTTFGKLVNGSKVNLERALTLNTRLGGHLVSGHVNGIGDIVRITPKGDNWFYHIKIDPQLMKYCINEGSIAVDGVSLTIAEITGNEIRISLISHTKNNTIFQYYKPGTKINIEVDLIAKYLESLIESGNRESLQGLDMKLLGKWGY